ncbi:MAG TPA: hypothetical protein VFB19_19345 [Mycobacterium sp.]|nr:hypothetical protein [Mycobacterium sp.]
MTNVNDRFAEILADYTKTMADIQPPTPAAEFDRRILRPADQQQAYRPPTIAPRV